MAQVHLTTARISHSHANMKFRSKDHSNVVCRMEMKKNSIDIPIVIERNSRKKREENDESKKKNEEIFERGIWFLLFRTREMLMPNICCIHLQFLWYFCCYFHLTLDFPLVCYGELLHQATTHKKKMKKNKWHNDI